MKKSIILSIIIIAILLIISLFLLIQNQSLQKEIVVLNSKIEELEKSKPKPVAEKIPEGWKEYVDEEYKFRIWYPEEFTSFQSTYIVNIQKNKFDDHQNIAFFIPFSSDALQLFDIYIYNNDLEQVIQNDAKNLRKSIEEFYKYKSLVKINGQEFNIFNISGHTRYYIEKNGMIFAFSTFEDEYTIDISNRMAQSFKFIE